MADDFQLSGQTAAERYETHALLFMEPFVVAMLKHAALQQGDALLDVACGTGVVARRAADVAHVTGVDLNEAMLAIASSKAANVEWKQGSAESLPVDDETFDVVTCQQGMQFFNDIDKAAREMHRVLKPGGRAIATVWAQLPQCPYFEAQSEALEKFIDKEAAQSVKKAIPEDGDALFKNAFKNGGFSGIEVEVVEAVVNLPEITGFAREQILATPWGQAYGQANEEAQKAFGAYFTPNLGQYAQEDGTYGVPFASFIAVATK